VEKARARVARLIGASPEEIVFTSGGTESDNLALFGTAFDRRFPTSVGESRGHIITSQIEHPAVLQSCRHLEELGYRVTYLPVDRTGRIAPEAVAEAIAEDTLLISIMFANNELGTLQPIREIGETARAQGIPFHVDAVQALGKVPLNLKELPVDMLSLSAHKIYGPKGIGALYVRSGLEVSPVGRGGHQERGLRPGTENVPGIVGFGKACELAARDWERNQKHLWALRERLLRVREELPAVRLNGHPTQTVPSTVNLCFMYVDGLTLQLNLSERGIYIATGSACTSGSLEPSHVLKALGLSDQAAFSSVRFTLGKDNTVEEMDYVVEQVKEVVEMLRLVTAPEDIGKCDENCPCLWEGVG